MKELEASTWAFSFGIGRGLEDHFRGRMRRVRKDELTIFKGLLIIVE
jgi:hypothetical protein